MKTQSKANADARGQAASVAEMTEVFRKNCEQALRTGLKFQEETGRWWGSVYNPAACVQRWQEQLNGITQTANTWLPLAQKPIGEVIDLAEKNSRASADLVKKALEAGQASSLSESQNKWADFWTSSLGALQSSAETVSQINCRLLDSWTDLIRKGTEPRTSRTT
jgi:hypothetical protein